MKRALIFDMDGVIVNNHQYHINSWKEFARQYGKEVGDDQVKSWFGSINKTILENFFEKKLTEQEIKDLGRKKEEIYREMYAKDIKPLNGLKNFLEHLNGSEFLRAVATSAPRENVDFVLTNTGLSSFFKIVTDESMVSHGKPDPEIFLKTAGRLEVHPSDCIVFEDSFLGIEAARRAGMKVIAVATTHDNKELRHADKVIHDFSEISLRDLINLFNNHR